MLAGFEVTSAKVDFPARQAIVHVRRRCSTSKEGVTAPTDDQAELVAKAGAVLVEEVEDIGFEASLASSPAAALAPSNNNNGGKAVVATEDEQKRAEWRNLWLMGCAEQGSNHPIAVGLTDFARRHLPEPDDDEWALAEPEELTVRSPASNL